MFRELFKTCLEMEKYQLKCGDYFHFLSGARGWRWPTSYWRRLYICENIDLMKLLLEAVTGCLSEKRYLKAIKNNLKLNQIPWKINKKEIIINNTASLQPTTLLKMNSLMNLFWRFQYFSSISSADFDTIRIQFLKRFIT